MNTAAKGRRLEHKTIRRLESEGYTCIRAAASKGAFDVHAFNGAHGRYIQSKANAWPGAVEMEALQLVSVPPGCSKEVWRWDDRAREPKVRVL
jgi:Holliday junction resolvase